MICWYYFKYDAFFPRLTQTLQAPLRSLCSMLRLKALGMQCVDHDEHIKSNHRVRKLNLDDFCFTAWHQTHSAAKDKIVSDGMPVCPTWFSSPPIQKLVLDDEMLLGAFVWLMDPSRLINLQKSVECEQGKDKELLYLSRCHDGVDAGCVHPHSVLS